MEPPHEVLRIQQETTISEMGTRYARESRD